MCGKNVTSSEHVPPLCLFPEKKDLPNGMDLRKQLITVPSCDEHNSAKSCDDEYLLYLLVINLPANQIAKNQFLTKLMRAIQDNPRMMNRILRNTQPVVVVDEETGEAQNTTAVNIDDARLDSALEHIARALYFHHFGEQWPGEVRTQPDFLLSSLNQGDIRNVQISDMAAGSDQLFNGAEYFGSNQEVFKYQVIDGNEQAPKLMRLHFYFGCRVSVFFLANV